MAIPIIRPNSKWIKEVEEELHHQTAGTSRRDRRRQQHVFLLARDLHGRPTLAVNHEASQVVLAKEVRHLAWLGFRVPAAVRLLADRASERYPRALALQAALRAWAATGKAAEARPEMAALLTGHILVSFSPCVGPYHSGLSHTHLGSPCMGAAGPVPSLTPITTTEREQALREVAEEAFVAKGLSVAGGPSSSTTLAAGGPHVRWDSPGDLAPWCARLSERAFALQEKAEECGALLDGVEAALRTVATCPYEPQAFRGALHALQGCVDDMAVAGYANLDRYVQALETRLRRLLRARLLGMLEAWVAAFEGGVGEKEKEQGKRNRVVRKRAVTRCVSAGGQQEGEEAAATVRLTLRRCVHEVVLQDQALFLSPPLEAAEARWVAQLHRWVNWLDSADRSPP